MFGLSPYLLLAAVFIWIASAGGGYIKGLSDCGAKNEIAQLERESNALRQALTEAKRRSEVKDRVAEQLREATQARDAEIESLEQKARDYEQLLADRPQGDEADGENSSCPSDCRLSADDVKRLQDIR